MSRQRSVGLRTRTLFRNDYELIALLIMIDGSGFNAIASASFERCMCIDSIDHRHKYLCGMITFGCYSFLSLLFSGVPLHFCLRCPDDGAEHCPECCLEYSLYHCAENSPERCPQQSWWVYESRAYTGSNMLSRITEAALATMVLAVVNQHHARLHTPLQVCHVSHVMNYLLISHLPRKTLYCGLQAQVACSFSKPSSYFRQKNGHMSR